MDATSYKTARLYRAPISVRCPCRAIVLVSRRYFLKWRQKQPGGFATYTLREETTSRKPIHLLTRCPMTSLTHRGARAAILGAREARTWEKTNDQVDCCCCLCLCLRNVGAGYVARAASSAGQLDHGNRLRMRSGQDTSSRFLCGQKHHSSGSQVCAMEWRQLRWVALLLSRDHPYRGGLLPSAPYNKGGPASP